MGSAQNLSSMANLMMVALGLLLSWQLEVAMPMAVQRHAAKMDGGDQALELRILERAALPDLPQAVPAESVDVLLHRVRTELDQKLEKVKRKMKPEECPSMKNAVAAVNSRHQSADSLINLGYEDIEMDAGAHAESGVPSQIKGVAIGKEIVQCLKQYGDRYPQLQELKDAFDAYAQDKRTKHIDGVMKAADVAEYVGLDVGGVGRQVGFLDLNVDDITNNPNDLVIGDARKLDEQFEENSFNIVEAIKLPIGVMNDHGDSQAARVQAVRMSLRSAAFVSSNYAIVTFNDNTGDNAVPEETLQECADEYGFTLTSDNAYRAQDMANRAGALGELTDMNYAEILQWKSSDFSEEWHESLKKVQKWAEAGSGLLLFPKNRRLVQRLKENMKTKFNAREVDDQMWRKFSFKKGVWPEGELEEPDPTASSSN